MDCNVFRELLSSYLDESLEEDRRGSFRRHLRECGPCRERALAEEPSLLFAAAHEPIASQQNVEACAVAVTARIRQQRLARRLQKSRRPWLAAAAAIVIVIAGGLIWKVMLGDIGGSAAPGIEAFVEEHPQTVPPTVEVEMAGEDVRVYQFAADDNNDTAVYFIVNPAMEL
jgi:predicted anti-sigma-YlaC factor YlaD